MERSLALFIMAAILCALFSDRIDMAVKGEQRVKKVILVFSAGVCSVCMIAVVAGILS